MNKLLNLYGVKIHSERAFLSFLENSRNEVEALSSSYLRGRSEILFFLFRQAVLRSDWTMSFLSFNLLKVGTDWYLGRRRKLLKKASSSDQKSEAITQGTVWGFFLFKPMSLLTQRSAMRWLSNLPAYSSVLVRSNSSLVRGFRKRLSMAGFKKSGSSRL